MAPKRKAKQATEQEKPSKKQKIAHASKQQDVLAEARKEGFIVQENVLTSEECEQWIEQAQSKKFFDAEVGNRKKKTNTVDENVRNNQKCVFEDAELCEKIWTRMKDKLPQTLGTDLVLSGLEKNWRMYKYENYTTFATHTDNAAVHDNGERSRLTLLIYLNSSMGLYDENLGSDRSAGMVGGQTTFHINYKQLSILPEEGLAVAFHHQIPHEAAYVVNGIKYVLRTNVLYKLKESSNAAFTAIVGKKEFKIPVSHIEQHPKSLLYNYMHSDMNTGKQNMGEFDRNPELFETYIMPCLAGKTFAIQNDDLQTSVPVLEPAYIAGHDAYLYAKNENNVQPKSGLTVDEASLRNEISTDEKVVENREREKEHWDKGMEVKQLAPKTQTKKKAKKNEVKQPAEENIQDKIIAQGKELDDEFKFWGLASPIDYSQLPYTSQSQEVAQVANILQLALQHDKEESVFYEKVLQVHVAHAKNEAALVSLSNKYSTYNEFFGADKQFYDFVVKQFGAQQVIIHKLLYTAELQNGLQFMAVNHDLAGMPNLRDDPTPSKPVPPLLTMPMRVIDLIKVGQFAGRVYGEYNDEYTPQYDQFFVTVMEVRPPVSLASLAPNKQADE